MANLRSQGQALAMYTGTSGFYPGLKISPGAAYTVYVWPTRLRAFLNGNRDVFLCPAREAELFAWSDGLVGMGGPAPASLGGFAYAAGEPQLGRNVRFSYGYNGIGAYFDPATRVEYGDYAGDGLGCDVLGLTPSGRYPSELRASRVKRPSELIAIADTGTYSTMCSLWALANTHGIGTIHRGGSNVLFCDGHVAWYHYNDITVPPDRGLWSQQPWRDICVLWRRDHNYPTD